ncbi:MAG: DUF1080 domain-containing protein, partial [Planctomycetales bacterium]
MAFALTRYTIILGLLTLPLSFVSAEDQGKLSAFAGDKEGWVSLFDGKSLDGWRASENTDSCKVEDGAIVVHGPRSHLFYVGDINQGKFKNFEFKCEVMTKPKANSGVYLHTEFQETGWPNRGYEVQVNNTGSDSSKTGGLYSVKDVTTA